MTTTVERLAATLAEHGESYLEVRDGAWWSFCGCGAAENTMDEGWHNRHVAEVIAGPLNVLAERVAFTLAEMAEARPAASGDVRWDAGWDAATASWRETLETRTR